MLYYKRANRKGNVWSINLKGASVVVTGSHQRQLIIVSGSVLYFIRTLHQVRRRGIVHALQLIQVQLSHTDTSVKFRELYCFLPRESGACWQVFARLHRGHSRFA